MGEYSFKLPDVGEGIAQAEVVAWHVKPGDVVNEDAPLVDVMTDKATVELTSPVTGKVARITGEIGGMVAIGSIIAVIETEGAGNAKPAKPAAPAPAAPPAAAKAAPPPSAPVAVPDAPSTPRKAPVPGARALAAPAVRRRAHELKIDLDQLGGSGPNGRITHQDLDDFGKGGGATRPALKLFNLRDDAIKLVGLRRKIAEKMALSKRSVAHYSYVEEVDVTELENLRAALNARHGATLGKLTLLPFWIQALVKAIPKFPQMNATFDDAAGLIQRHGSIHVGIAAQTPNGLMVPVLRDAQTRSLWNMAAEIRRVSDAAKAGKAKSEELSGSTITLTSLGTTGGMVTTPIVNHPEVAIIGPNKIAERPVVRHGQIVIRKMMNLSSSFDHRVVDGAEAADFVQELKQLIETPALLFVDQA